ncbi:hypothetical protein D9757_010436 [Collybiopsis confluens]|uniref:C2H2-type domain-containing protein n=1 Tax=Collybiopsis confluens TaxID=2823264 RepID=A0A8H5GPK9_9AGAR|nr:hypothetical protein D9757_010436 [Collybiopsis confluens]
MAFAPHFPADSSPNMTLDPSGEYSWGELEQILAGSSTAAVIPEQSSPLDYHSDSDANLALKFGASFEPSPFTLGTWEGPFDPNVLFPSDSTDPLPPSNWTHPDFSLPKHLQHLVPLDPLPSPSLVDYSQLYTFDLSLGTGIGTPSDHPNSFALAPPVTKIDGFEEAQVRTTPDDNWKLFADLTGLSTSWPVPSSSSCSSTPFSTTSECSTSRIERRTGTCRWQEPNGEICGHIVDSERGNVSNHLLYFHGHNLPTGDKMKTCLWEGCTAQPMQGIAMARHVKAHLGFLSLECPRCGGIYAREYCLDRHVEKCDGLKRRNTKTSKTARWISVASPLSPSPSLNFAASSAKDQVLRPRRGRKPRNAVTN